jgi:hypothetical protein
MFFNIFLTKHVDVEDAVDPIVRRYVKEMILAVSTL